MLKFPVGNSSIAFSLQLNITTRHTVYSFLRAALILISQRYMPILTVRCDFIIENDYKQPHAANEEELLALGFGSCHFLTELRRH